MAIGNWMQALNLAKGLPSKSFLALHELNLVSDVFRGKSSPYYLKAVWLENQVWQRIEEIIDDPDRLFAVIKDTVESLRSKEADLSARIKPMDERLAEIAGQKARLADDWVIRHMDNEKFKELKDNFDREEIRIRA